MNDEEEVVRAKKGDREALERLLEKHIASVFQVVRRVLPSGEIDDVVQDVLLQAYIGLDGLRKPEVFGKWIRTIAYNRAMQWHRKRYAETAIFPRIWEPDKPEYTVQVELTIDMGEALELLSPSDREAIRLHYFEGWSSTEIAKLQGRVASTVRWRLSKSLSSLKNILEKGSVIDDEPARH